MPPLKYLLTPSLALLPGLVAQTLIAADAVAQDERERWYQVELLIFSHETGAGGEQWEPLPQLAYPDASRFLVYPEQVTAREQAHDGISELDEFGRQFLRLEPETIEEDKAATPNIPQQPSGQTPANNALTGTSGADIELDNVPRSTPTPFIALPRRSAEFYGKAAYMQRSGQYKTLFHETWVQPVRDERSALPLIIDRSGDTGEWPRLQGSVKLHISRFLHLNTNLWLNTPGGYLPGDWQMPAPPLGPPSLIVEEPEPEADDYFISDSQPAAEMPMTEALEGDLVEQEDLGPRYPWRHAVLMQQKRKMRSKEVHYLDHPLLGVVIKLMPLDEEQLQELADAERTGQGE